LECYYEAGVGVVVPKSIVLQVSEEEEDGDTNSRSKKRKNATNQSKSSRKKAKTSRGDGKKSGKVKNIKKTDSNSKRVEKTVELTDDEEEEDDVFDHSNYYATLNIENGTSGKAEAANSPDHDSGLGKSPGLVSGATVLREMCNKDQQALFRGKTKTLLTAKSMIARLRDDCNQQDDDEMEHQTMDDKDNRIDRLEFKLKRAENELKRKKEQIGALRASQRSAHRLEIVNETTEEEFENTKVKLDSTEEKMRKLQAENKKLFAQNKDLKEENELLEAHVNGMSYN